MPAGFIAARLQWPAALDQLDNQYNQRNNEQDMNESAQGVRADQPKQPEHEQDHKYSPEHKIPFGRVFACFVRGGSVALIGVLIKTLSRVANPAVATGLWPI
jgi:hypothetical protein